jgi:hypothetical protein
MWLELAGGAAAWLAHVLWYLASPSRCRTLELGSWLTQPHAGWLLRASALVLISASLAFWVQAHGLALGTGSAIAALTAAASLNAIVAPLTAQGLLAFAALAFVALAVGTWEWLHGA